MDSSDDDFDAMPVRIRGSTSSAQTPSQLLAYSPEGPPTADDDISRCPQKAVKFNLDSESHETSANVKQYSSNGQDLSYDRDTSVFQGSELESNEEFQPTETAEFLDDLDFLEGRGGKDSLASERQAALARQSLYTKFDPLVSNPAEAARSRLSELNRREDPFVQCPDAAASVDLSSLTMSNERSSREQSPASSTPVDNVFSPMPTPKRAEQRHDSSRASLADREASQLVEPLLYTQSDLDAVVNSRQQDQGKKVLELQAKLKSERAESNGKQEQMKKELNEMKRILGEYEKTIIDLTENSQRNTMIKDETLSDLIKEKEQLRADLNTAENGILDAYKRVETLKTAVSNYGSNETKLKSCIDDFKEKLRRSEERYQTLKKHAEEKLDYANREIGKVRKAKDVDMAGLDATVKKSQAKIASLEHSLEQKIAENVELTKICDDLISRVSGKES